MRRFAALVATTMLPAGAVLVYAGRRDAALGLCFGALIAALNASMLARRINKSATQRVTQAQRVMQQGMGIRFSMILLASVVVIKTTPAAIPTFVLGLVVTMALAIAVAARALLATAPLSALGISHPMLGESQYRAIGHPPRLEAHSDLPKMDHARRRVPSPPGLGERLGERARPPQRTPLSFSAPSLKRSPHQ